MSKFKGLLLIISASIIWGGGFIATSYALEGIPVMTTLALRFLLSSLILLVFCFKKLRETDLKQYLSSSVLGIFIFLAFYFQTIGNANTSVSNNSFLTALNVVFTPFIAWLVFLKKPKRSDYIASILSVLGVSLLTMSTVEFGFNKGDLYSLIGAIFFAFHVVWSTKLKRIDAIVLTFTQMLTAGVISLVFAIFVDSPLQLNQIDPRSIMSLIYLVIMSTLVGYLLQLYASKVLSPDLISVVLSTEALFATVFSVILLGEILTLKSIISMVLLISAVVVSVGSNVNKEKTVIIP